MPLPGNGCGHKIEYAQLVSEKGRLGRISSALLGDILFDE
jgi:hypothetical protein